MVSGWIALVVLAGAGVVFSGRADEAADRLALAVDALTRVEPSSLEKSPKLKERVMQVLEKTRGTPGFVRLVRHFNLPGQQAGLIEVAAAWPKDENGVEAARLALSSGPSSAVAGALAKADVRALGLAEALGNTGQREAAKLLLPLVTTTGTASALREMAIRSLVKIAEGAKDLMALVQNGTLSDPHRNLALDELSHSRWPDVQSAAKALMGQTVVKLPPMAELVRMKGDPTRGAAVYRRASPGCISCHVVKGQGTELGPNLSEIGSKLTREALYQAILEPSAGISFGFEAFTLTLKDGDEAYGLIASETPEEVTLKAVGGILTRYKKSEIASRQKSTLSIMPAGLEAGMSTQEFVDLVEYLSSLKKTD